MVMGDSGREWVAKCAPQVCIEHRLDLLSRLLMGFVELRQPAFGERQPSTVTAAMLNSLCRGWPSASGRPPGAASCLAAGPKRLPPFPSACTGRRCLH